MSSVNTPATAREFAPSKPWHATPRQRAETASILLLSLLAAVLLVAVTPLKGKLAYAVSFAVIYLVADYLIVRLAHGKAAGADAFFRGLVTISIAVVILPILSILWSVWSNGHKGLHWSLFTTDMHSTSFTDEVVGHGGLMHAIIGSMLIVGAALVIAVPVGVLTAVYMTEIKGRFTRPIKFLVQSMSGVPSIVAGLFILAAIVYPVTKFYSGVEGSLALAILMIPTIARTAEEVLLLIPNDLRESGVALGGTQWRTVAQIVLPAARSGLITSLILGVARVAGETAPIVLLTGGGDTTSWNLFKGPMGTLPFYIWRAYGSGTEASVARAWTGILVLLIIVLVLFGAARIFGSGKKK
jgi:phosphate transport system permease protein